MRCKHCALAVVRRSQQILPRRRPLPGGTGQPKYWLEMVTTFTYKPSLVRITQCTQFRVIMVTDTHTHRRTHRQDRLQYTAPQLACTQTTCWYAKFQRSRIHSKSTQTGHLLTINNNTTKKNISLGFMETIPSPWLGFLVSVQDCHTVQP